MITRFTLNAARESRRLALVLAALFAIVVGVAGPAHAAQTYFVSSGSGHVAQGSVSWSNRTVFLHGSIKAPSGSCALMVVQTFRGSDGGPNTTRTVCSGTRPYDVGLQWNVVGGPTSVRVTLYTGSSASGPWSNRGWDDCFRDSSFCTSG
jgi:hypothetical protein